MLIFSKFGLKMPVHGKMEVYGRFYPLNREQSHCDSRKAPCAQVCHMSRSVHPFLNSSPIYSLPRNLMLCNRPDIPLKVPLVAWVYPTQGPSQTTSRLVQPFLQAYDCDRQTGRPTNRPRYSVCNSRPRLHMYYCDVV